MPQKSFNITQVNGLKDIQRLWQFWVQVPTIGSAVPAAVNQFLSNDTGLMSYLKQVAFPGKQISNSLLVNFGGMQKKYSGKPTWGGTFSTVLAMHSDDITIKQITDWQEAMVSTKQTNTTNSTFAASDTIRNLESDWLVLKLDATGSYNDNTTCVKIYNVWPSAVADVQFDMNSETAGEVSVTWSYDYADINQLKYLK